MQQFLNIITNPVTIFVLFALFGALGRFASWVKDQRARRAALQARAEQKAESLRTGKPLDRPSSSAQAEKKSEVSERQAQLRAMQEQRAAQLRELQQRRLAELRARRQASQSAQSGQPMPTQPMPTQGGASSGSQTRAQPGFRPGSRAGSAAAGTQQARQENRQEPRNLRPAPAPPAPRPVPGQPERAIAPSPDPSQPHFRPYRRPSDPVERGPTAREQLFGTREQIRRAIIAAEVLGPPLALRDQDQSSI